MKSNYVVLTGGPGSGKSAIIDLLSTQGYACVQEVGRQIIQEQLAMGGNALHWGDRVKFRDLMLTRSIKDYEAYFQTKDWVFFDRGIPDLVGYSYLINEPVSQACQQAVQDYRYYSTVFMAPPWEEVYQNDAERKQDFQEAIDTYEAIKRGYQENGYHIVVLPKYSVSDRIAFIFDVLSKKNQ